MKTDPSAVLIVGAVMLVALSVLTLASPALRIPAVAGPAEDALPALLGPAKAVQPLSPRDGSHEPAAVAGVLR